MKEGRIITFYSYKGGVGRSMALANISAVLAKWGYNILVVDWDLEAPGIEKFYLNYCDINIESKLGVVDLLTTGDSINSIDWSNYFHDVNLSENSSLKLLCAGKKGADYYTKLGELDIDRLYEKKSGFELFEKIRNDWKSNFDFILIDSRTGITDIGGICTIQLPDIVFVLTTTNEQNILGTKEIIERIKTSQQAQPYDRQNLIVFPVLSRFDTTTEFEFSQLWIRKFYETLKEVYDDWLPISIDTKEFTEKTKIPYFPYFSFGEKLSVIEQGVSDPAGMGYAYESLSSIIVNNFERINEFILDRSDYIRQASYAFRKDLAIKVIGVGGGGINAVNRMFERGIQGVEFILCNTDEQSLDASPVHWKIQLGKELTDGKGAGSIPEVGRNAAIESLEEVKKVFTVNTSVVFIVAGLGGGTGTGASPIIAKAAKEMGILTVGIVTIPFVFEGRKRALQAWKGQLEMQDIVDSLLVLRNDKLRELHGNLTLNKAFTCADDMLYTAVKGMTEVITRTGEVNFDFNNLKLVLSNSGSAIMGYGVANGSDRAMKAVKKALESPLLNDNEIYGARFILLNITYGTEEALMDEIMAITDYIQEMAGLSAEVIWGSRLDTSLGHNLSVTVIATGFHKRVNSHINLDSMGSQIGSEQAQGGEPEKAWSGASPSLPLFKQEPLFSEQGVSSEDIRSRGALGDSKVLNLIIKGDLDESVEVLNDGLQRVSIGRFPLHVIHKSVGQISESDVLLASASDAIIIGYQVRPTHNAHKLAEKEGVKIILQSIMKTAINDFKETLEGRIQIEENIIGIVGVRETFRIQKIGTIAGCFVLDGFIKRNSNIKVVRDDLVIYVGKLGSLKRFKEDATKVLKGQECGLNIEGFNDIKVGDYIEAFERVQKK